MGTGVGPLVGAERAEALKPPVPLALKRLEPVAGDAVRAGPSGVQDGDADAGDPRARRAVPPLRTPPDGDLRAVRPAADRLESIAGAGR